MILRTAGIDEWLEHKCQTVLDAATVRIDLFVRSLAPPPGPRKQQEHVFERLETHADADRIDDVTVNVWGTGICLDGTYSDTPVCRRIRSKIDRFRTWANGEQAAVSLPFETRSVSSSIIDAEYTRLVPPRICLAVYAGDDLALVLPCSIDDASVCVGDFLDELERGIAADTPVESSEPQTSSQ